MVRSSWLTCVLALAIGSAALTARAAPAGSALQPEARSQSTAGAQPQDFYALGVLLSHNLDLFDLSEREFKQVLSGVADGYHHRAHLTDQQAALAHLMTLQNERQVRVVQREQAAGAAFIAKVAALSNARKTASGLVYLPIAEGAGATPRLRDRIKVQYTGKLIDGTVFDSTTERGEGASFAMTGVIPCWKEALQLMKAGGRARVLCPPELAYGDRGSPPIIRPGATLDFQIELLDVIEPPASSRGAVLPTAPRAPSPTQSSQ